MKFKHKVVVTQTHTNVRVEIFVSQFH